MFKYDAISALLGSDNEAVVYFTRRALKKEEVELIYERAKEL